MENSFSEEEKKSIVIEAIESKKKKLVAEKYGIHVSTLYDWINIERKKKTRSVNIKVRVTEDEKKILLERANSFGYKRDISTYIRKILFSKHILVGDPRVVGEEFFRIKGELNKIGSNVNQVANYTNFLKNKNYVENDFVKDIVLEASRLNMIKNDMKEALDKAIRKIIR